MSTVQRQRTAAATSTSSLAKNGKTIPAMPAKFTRQSWRNRDFNIGQITVSLDVIVKLLVFATALATLPFVAYFAASRYLFDGNTTYSGLTAAFVANVVVFGYVAVAVMEDQEDDGDVVGSSTTTTIATTATTPTAATTTQDVVDTKTE